MRRFFGKDIPDDRTGESLEASTLPGLESRTEDGALLTEVVGGRLPLLLKLIDAKEALSVQVHPDDAYAHANEGGKLGKTEAWLILHAEPDAKVVYGLTPGTDVKTLDEKQIEAHLRWVPVKAQDVLYIPAGMVHAIGGGILLYEIQETSDVTYRFWDWERYDAQGNPRELHWKQAMDVSKGDVQLNPISAQAEPCEGGSITRALDAPYFTLEILHPAGQMPLPVKPGFQFVTAMGSGRLVRGNEVLPFRKGDTIYIREGMEKIIIESTEDMIISTETYPNSGED